MFWLLVGYMFLFIHRPFEIWPILGDLRIELVYMLITGITWLATPGKRFVADPLNVAFAAFFGAVVICSLASPWSASCLVLLDSYYKFFVFYLMLVTVVRDEEDLKRLLLFFECVIGVYMLHSLREFLGGHHVYRMGIVRLMGVGLTASDPNAFGATIVLAQVFVPALWRNYPSRWVRMFLLGFLGLSAICIGLTGSRGAFVLLLLWYGLAVWQSRWRMQLLVLAIPAAPLLFFALPEKLQTRFETIINPEVGPKNALESAEGRREGFLIGVQLIQQNPLTGIGPEAWIPATGRTIKAHNLYGQLMGEMGLFGVVTFGGVIVAFGIDVYRVRRAYREHPEWGKDFLHDLAGAVGVAVFLLLFAGTFGHNLFRYTWVWYGAFLAIAHGCVQRRLAETSVWPWETAPAELAAPMFSEMA